MSAIIPSEVDWRSEPWGLDTSCAYKHFSGKSFEEAVALFKENSLCYQEDVMFMPRACFPFYVRAYMAYLMSEDSREDSDGASSFFGIAMVRAKDIGADESLVSSVTACLEHLARHQDFYDAEVSIYGSFIERAQEALSELLCQRTHK